MIARKPLRQPKLSLYLALSRTPHGIVDIATPALAALLCLGAFPPLTVSLLGLITVFAGYTAVYALNDIVDYRVDREKIRSGAGSEKVYPDLDNVLMRHPLATGSLSYAEGLAWTAGWALVALVGAWLLNPVCVAIFLAGGFFEAVYCSLLRVTPLRTLINGVVKSLGAIAAVYAVHPAPSLVFLLVLFAWIFLWEIGGQNIPNDWTDIEEDRRLKAKTIPVQLGRTRAGLVSLVCLLAAFFFTYLLLWISPLSFNAAYLTIVSGLGFWLLLLPGLRMVEGNSRRFAMQLFNKASHFPLGLLVIVLIRLLP